MKIVQINAVYQTGSTGRIVMELHRALMDLKQESYVFTSDGNCIDANVFPLGSKLDHKAHALCSRLSGEQGYFSAGATKVLLRKLDRLAPDVVHLHNLHGNYIHLPMLLNYLRKKDIATVITLHDCWFFTGKCTHYTIQGCQRWQSGCYGCPKLKNDNASWFFDRTPKMWSDKKKLFTAIPRLGVIGVSDWITNEAKKSFLQHAAVIRRIYNWIDLDIFSPRNRAETRDKLGLKYKFVLMGVASGWSPQKGINDFIALAEHLEDDEQIVLVGRMPKINYPPKITVISATNNASELAALYSTADVFLQLSQEETFGKVVVEAMACGTPVITNRFTANPELVGEKCGVVVKETDPISLTNAIMRIKGTKRETYEKACREFSVENFNQHQLIKDTMKVYEDLIGC